MLNKDPLRQYTAEDVANDILPAVIERTNLAACTDKIAAGDPLDRDTARQSRLCSNSHARPAKITDDLRVGVRAGKRHRQAARD